MPIQKTHVSFKIFIYLWLCWVVVATPACLWLQRAGTTLVAEHRLLVVEASFVAEHELWGLQQCGSQALEHRLNRGGTRPQLLRGKWDLPGTEIEPKSSGLAGRFFTTELPGKPHFCLKNSNFFLIFILYTTLFLLLQSLLLQIKIRFLINNSNNNTAIARVSLLKALIYLYITHFQLSGSAVFLF